MFISLLFMKCYFTGSRLPTSYTRFFLTSQINQTLHDTSHTQTLNHSYATVYLNQTCESS